MPLYLPSTRDVDQKWYDKFDKSRMIAEVARPVRERIAEDIEDEDEAQKVLNDYLKPVRFTFGVCPRCNGRGGYVDPQIDGNGLSNEDLADADFRSDYFAGAYDVICDTCEGANVVPVTDDESVKNALNDLLQEAEDFEAERAAERRMGC
jgi:hypothetical protein